MEVYQWRWQCLVCTRRIEIIPIGSFIDIIFWGYVLNLVISLKLHGQNLESSSFKICWLISRYLQVRTPKIRSKLLIPTIQAFFLLFALLCSISRITDNRHHWWDVLAGAKIGILFASLVVSCIHGKPLHWIWCELFLIKNSFLFSAYFYAKISKWKKFQWWSRFSRTGIQSIIDTRACVASYPNEPKMIWA